MDASAYFFEKVSRFWFREGKLGGDQWPPSGQQMEWASGEAKAVTGVLERKTCIEREL